ncbi:sensor histidine kinase [Marinirhabdus gelatinilytica]|uniref:histidine kinase n=1 Tax=Marinirhabdus gelatinilytica TaxID=1703343 RepID=A0A370Q9X0_9FLAO|nr:HAMP domain-containing sensor histidine kinase [Marinirhabdus gelatinilytica]RDK85186.1 phospho-acceptor domain-containing protein [Marinirhabdus gelatinilytica]
MKFKILIAISIFTLLSLVGIQGYLIYNTYELKQKTITIDARNAIARIYTSPKVDSIAWRYRNDFLTNLEAYRNNQIDNGELLKRLEEKSTEINPGFIEIFNKGLKKYDADFDIKIKKIVTSITVTDSLGSTETLYPESRTDTIVLLGENFNSNEALLINNSSWKKDHDVTTPNGIETVDLDFKSSIYMNISNWNSLLIRELSVLLILSTLLFLFVVGLLYYSIQNLLKQKRVAEIKTDFINNITHELKTPLSTLSLATKTLTSEYAKGNKEVANEAIAVVERQNTRLQKLIDQVLKSSLGYKEIQLNKEECNATTFLNDLLDDYGHTLSEDVSILRDIENTGVLLVADTFYIGTAIINLLNNAVKYGGTHLQVTYSLDTELNSHTISVMDNGIGIAPKYQKYIFGKFYRVGEKDTHNYKGLGLGLYYTDQIIKAHNGTIEVYSNEGEGTTFTIKIPVSA